MPKRHPISDLIDQGEGQQLDFKFEISDARKIARSLVAFANTDGGRLLVGVKDNGRIAGVRSEEEYYMVESAAQRFCKPEIPFESKEWNVDGKKVLEIIIHPGKELPYKAPDKEGRYKAYIRSSDQNLLASKVQMEVWRHQKSGRKITIEYKEAEAMLMDLLSDQGRITLSMFARKASIPHRIAVQILVKFILLDVIKAEVEESAVYYRANEVHAKDELY